MSANTNSSYNCTMATTRAVTRSQSKDNSNIRLLCPPKQSIGLNQFLKEQKNKRTNNITLTCEEKDTSKPPSLLLPEEAGYKPEAIPEATNKPVKKNNTLKQWFVKYIKEMLYNLDIVNETKRNICESFGTGDNSKKEVELKKEYYNSLRIVIEMFYNINEYLPELNREEDYVSNKIAKATYNKIQDLYKSIHDMETLLHPKTDEEYEIIRSIVQVLEDTEKTVIQYLPTEKLLPLLLPNKKRNRKPVDYTGMDTIEPYDEYDAITDIWYDKSLAYDSDYVPEEDEEDDDDDDDEELEDEELEDEELEDEELEDEDNYSESEDYVDEEEDEEELEQDALEEAELLKFSVNKEPKKVYKSANHIVFEYDE